MADILTKDAAHRSAMTRGSDNLLEALCRAYPHIEKYVLERAHDAKCLS
jgi:hypothetical protein